MKNRMKDLTPKEIQLVLLKTTGITGVIMLLFYRSFWPAIIAPFVFIWQWKHAKKERIEVQKNQLKEEFLHGIGVLNDALHAGLSMENAWREVENEIRVLYGENSEFYLALKEMNQRVAHNVPIETLFLEFAYKCKVEEIIQFAELLEFGKRSGSNWKKIIDTTVRQMTEQYEAKLQIEVVVAEKKMEQQVMNILPLGMLMFLQLSAWDYMEVLYHNWFGVISMTVFLIGYVMAIVFSQKILRIEL